MPNHNGNTERTDVIISGAGLIGLTMALALARAGLSVHLVDRRIADAVAMRAMPGSDDGKDIRASAIIRSSWQMFAALDLEKSLLPHAEPITAIEVRDGTDGPPLRFGDTDNQTDELMGYMIPNSILAGTLYDAVADHALVHCHFGQEIASQSEKETGVSVVLDNQQQLQAGLMIIAEGRNSQSRDAKGFAIAKWQYDHHAIVATLAHERPHHGVAYELFLPGGPLAMLPLPDLNGQHTSSLVWSLSAEKAEGYLALSQRGFAEVLHSHMGNIFGAFSQLGERARYPLTFHNVGNPVSGRVVVIGDGAHAVHPIAGQGFNLGLRDIACLTEILAEGVRMGLDCGNPQLLARYSNWRSCDVIMMAAATDGLTRLFGVDKGLIRGVRRKAMQMINSIAPLRGLIATQARGEAGKLPRLLQGLEV